MARLPAETIAYLRRHHGCPTPPDPTARRLEAAVTRKDAWLHQVEDRLTSAGWAVEPLTGPSWAPWSWPAAELLPAGYLAAVALEVRRLHPDWPARRLLRAAQATGVRALHDHPDQHPVAAVRFRLVEVVEDHPALH